MKAVSKVMCKVFSLRELTDQHRQREHLDVEPDVFPSELLCIFTLGVKEAKTVYTAVKSKTSHLGGHLDRQSLSPSTGVNMK